MVRLTSIETRTFLSYLCLQDAFGVGNADPDSWTRPGRGGGAGDSESSDDDGTDPPTGRSAGRPPGIPSRSICLPVRLLHANPAYF